LLFPHSFQQQPAALPREKIVEGSISWQYFSDNLFLNNGNIFPKYMSITFLTEKQRKERKCRTLT
jgi:hypothetical protein